MDAIKLSATIDENRRLVIDLPKDVPVGPVKLIIFPERPLSDKAQDINREIARAKLLIAGALATDLKIADDLAVSSEEELTQMGHLPPGARPSEELIGEDRGTF